VLLSTQIFSFLPVGLHFVDSATAHCFASKTISIYLFRVEADLSPFSVAVEMVLDKAFSETLENAKPKSPSETD
jgi:hypothetical protein